MMRRITVKYAGECHKCHAALEVGAEAMYEKTTGIFCVGCEPTDPEEIRKYRQVKADRRADKYEEWAGKRREKIQKVWDERASHYDDHAFNFQPGYIPERARLIKREEKAIESLQVAKRMEEKAKSIRHVRVKGDAEHERQLQRDAIKAVLRPGMDVDTIIYGIGAVKRVNKKTATVTVNGTDLNIDLSFLKIM